MPDEPAPIVVNPDGSVAPFDPGCRPSPPDPRDHYASAHPITLPAGFTATAPPYTARDIPLPQTYTQAGGSCVGFAVADAVQQAAWHTVGHWLDLDVLSYFTDGGGDYTYGWEVRAALDYLRRVGIKDNASGKMVKASAYWRVPSTVVDVELAIACASVSPGRSPVLWETAWPDPWFNPAAGTGLLSPGQRGYIYGHCTVLWRYIPRIYGGVGIAGQGRNSWGAAWGIGGGNYSVDLSDVLAPELLWGLWQFDLDPATLPG